jgi:hypothetical protein
MYVEGANCCQEAKLNLMRSKRKYNYKQQLIYSATLDSVATQGADSLGGNEDM